MNLTLLLIGSWQSDNQNENST